jgi:tetratricopeptide (TPR) repeat protein
VDTLECCLARHLLVRLEDGRYDFSHGLIREILVRELCPERRRLLHRRVAAALVEWRRESQAGEIAHHYLEAEMWAMALDYLEQAGHAALRLFAYQEAWPYFARAYEVLERLGLEAPERWYAVVCQMAHIYSVTGRREEAGAYLHQALELARVSNESAWLGETLQALCRHCFVGGEVERALKLSEEAVALSQRAGDARQEANALRQHGYLLYRSGRHEEAFAALEEALPLSRLIGDRQIEAQNLNVLGVVRYYHGDYARALALWKEALHICRDVGFKPVLAQVAGNLGEVYRALGCYPEALAYRQEGLEVARAIGFRTIQPDGLLDTGMTLSDLGRHQEAIPFVEDALALASEVGHRHFVVHALNGLARIRLRMGGQDQSQQALALAEEAVDVAREITLRHGEAMALSLRGQALLALGQVDAACAASQAAVELLEGQGVAEGDERRVYFHHAQNLSAQGKASEAAIYLAEAKARMEAKATRIADADLRQNFLENVPINRSIRQAWQDAHPGG